MRVLALTAAALATTAIAAPAAAQAENEVAAVVVMPREALDGPNRLSQAVPYHDIDLRTHAGQEHLKWRVKMAARQVCRDLGEIGAAGGSALGRSCEQDAIARTRTVTVAQGQEVAIQQVKDVLRAGAAIHAVMRDAEGVAIWSGRDA